MRNRTEITGILENDDFLWLIRLTTGHGVSIGIEDFEGKLVKLTRYQDKLIIEVIHETEPISLGARELCPAGIG